MSLSAAKKKLAKLKKKIRKRKEKAIGKTGSVSSSSTRLSSSRSKKGGNDNKLTKENDGKRRNNSENDSKENSTESASAQADAALDAADALPPQGSSRLAALANFLKAVLRELGGQDKSDKDDGDLDKKGDSDAPALDAQAQHKINSASRELSKAQADAAPAKAISKIGGAAVSAATKGAAKLARRNTDEMSAADLRKAIDDTDAAIKDGKVLLPADAGLLARALAVLKKALMELGGVKGSFKNKDELEDLFEQKLKSESANRESGDSEAAKKEKASVAKAVEGVQRAQQNVAHNRRQRGEPTSDPSNPSLNTVKRIDADKLDAKGLVKAVDDVEKAIKSGKTLAPKNGSLLQRALFALKMALFELGGVDPQKKLTNNEELLDSIKDQTDSEAEQSQRSLDHSPEKTVKINKVKAAVDEVKEAEAQIARQQNSKGRLGGAEVQEALKAISETPPDKMTEKQLRAAIKSVDDAIKSNKMMLPADASLLIRLLYILKNALFELGGVKPEWDYEDKQEWIDQLDALEREREVLNLDSMSESKYEGESNIIPNESDNASYSNQNNSEQDDSKPNSSDQSISQNNGEQDNSVPANNADGADDNAEQRRSDTSENDQGENNDSVANQLNDELQQDKRLLPSKPNPEQIEAVNSATDNVIKEQQRLSEKYPKFDAEAEQAAWLLLTDVPAEDMTEQQLRDAVNAVDAVTDKGKVLLPADAGFLSQLLHILKQALFNLGGSDPKWFYEEHEERKTRLADIDKENREREANLEASGAVNKNDDLNTGDELDAELEKSSAQVDVQTHAVHSPLLNPEPQAVDAVNEAIRNVVNEQQRLG